jgi:ComF family protein
MLINRCAGCSEPGADLCRRCRFTLVASPPVVTASGIVAATQFAGLTKELIVGLKYRNRRRLAVHLAEQLSRRLDPTQIDVITWAPTSSRRARRRGYDQAELLARALAERWRKPCRRMLYRRHGVAQTGRTRDQRLHGPQFASRPVRNPPRVLVIDDVVTTGSTLHNARAALLAAGVRSVVLAAVAATPDHSRPDPLRHQQARRDPSGRDQARPASRSTAAMAGAASTSTTTPYMPRRSAASTLAGRSSTNAVRPAVALSLVRASS